MSDFTLNKNEHIKYIIDNFDFKKVHNVMKFLNWHWFFTKGVPSEKDLKNEAIRLLNDIYFSDAISLSTGGLKVTKYEDSLELEFILSDYSSEILNYGVKYEKAKLAKNRNKKLNTIEKLENEND